MIGKTVIRVRSSRRLVNDIFFGWLLGMATVGAPIIYFKFSELKKQIAFLQGNGELKGPQKDGDLHEP